MDAVRTKLSEIEKQYKEIVEKLMDEKVMSDPKLLTKLSKEQARLTQPVEAYHQLLELDSRIAQADEMLKENDPELKEMARMEKDECEPEREALLERIQHLLVPRDPDDDHDVIMEIRGGAGGDEGNIFAGDLYRMYSKYAESKGWKVQVLEASVSEAGGYTQIIFSVKGTDVYKELKFESGVHRVQRVPKTETQGRIHTSTATVLCQPEAEDTDIEIDPKDLTIETHRASGAGGQHINKTDSAVRMTHKPTGIVVQCQSQRSQMQNREQALRLLRAKLFELELEKQAELKEQIGGTYQAIEWGSQIRSYVFHPYNMVKDHRTSVETGNVQAVMDGNIDQFIEGYLKKEANLTV